MFETLFVIAIKWDPILIILDTYVIREQQKKKKTSYVENTLSSTI